MKIECDEAWKYKLTDKLFKKDFLYVRTNFFSKRKNVMKICSNFFYRTRLQNDIAFASDFAHLAKKDETRDDEINYEIFNKC